MRKIILNLTMSLDGYIEGPQGEYDWCFTDQDYGMTEFLQRTDAIFFGRRSYDLIQVTDPDSFADKTRYVFSNKLKNVAPGWILVQGDIPARVKEIRSQAGGDIWLFGGADLLDSFLQAGWVDEMMLAVHPLLLGGGTLLFQALPERIPLRLLEAKTYSTGLVQLIYEVKKDK